MVTLIEMMLKDRVITQDNIARFIKLRPVKKISFTNLISEKIVSWHSIEIFLIEKIKEGLITLAYLENIEDLDISLLIEKLAIKLQLSSIDLDGVEIDINLFSKIPYKQLLKYNIIPIEEKNTVIKIAIDDPFNMAAQDMIQRVFPQKQIKITIATPKQIKHHLRQMEVSESIKGLVLDIKKELNQEIVQGKSDKSPAVLKLIDVILKSAIYAEASDIHVEATEKSCIVRERVDGMLRQSFIFDKHIFNPLSSRIKLLANIDIAERRKPQDGRFSTILITKEFDFRVSTLPTIHGESIVIRILDKSKVILTLEEVGMRKSTYDKFFKAIHAPYGIVLVTGPTGSGKTTTLYGALNTIKDVKDKIITVEDPVEYKIAGLQQVQVQSAIGIDFSTVLKSILRQDPDKIMIGEIRDQETLRIAIQSALTGHLVLSTLHTNNALLAIDRILDMGIEPYLVSGALVGIQAQRLVRKICRHCKRETILSETFLKNVKCYLPKNPTFYKGDGCKECRYSGYAGREMISEILMISESLAHMIARGATKEEMLKQAILEGFVSMFEDGLSKVLEGVTTLEELYRVVKL